MSDEKTEEKVTSTDATPSDDGGDKSKADEEIKQINTETERINKAIADKENAEARAKMGGVTVSSQPKEKKEEISPEDYLGKVLKGEFNVKE